MTSPAQQGTKVSTISARRQESAARGRPALPGILCKAALEKVAGSVTFSRAGQLRRLIGWLGERSIGSTFEHPSERQIAAAVLGRADFDPQTDSLVRKEMSRLRDKLSRYYETEGAEDEIRIGAGSGYLFLFQRNDRVAARSGKLCCLVLPFRCEANLNDPADQLLEDLIFGLAQQGTYDLVARTTAMAYRGKAGDARELAAECSADVIVEGSLRTRDALIEATVWLVDGRAGRVLRSGKVREENASRIGELVLGWLVESAGAPPGGARASDADER